MEVVLVTPTPEGERRSFSVARDQTVIGRRQDCNVRIPLGDVSRKHCRLLKTDDGITLEDLGSTNGTIHNGQKISEPTALSAGDKIRVGSVTFVVQIDGSPDEEELTEILASLRQPSADETHHSAGKAATATEDDDDDWIDLAPSDEAPAEKPEA
jgi:pSer/pThr/pTyr-binding forkhead associated (FHA) protein